MRKLSLVAAIVWWSVVLAFGQAASPTFTPAGPYNGKPTYVAISCSNSGAISCWNLTDSPAPATNGLGNACASGSSLYLNELNVTASQTIYAVCGTSSLADSPVTSAAFSIFGGGGPAGGAAFKNAAFKNGSFFAGNSVQSGTPQLPSFWVDNLEAFDGLVYTPPAYELVLSHQATCNATTQCGAWVTGPPAQWASCATNNFLYDTTATGKQNFINDMEACRTYGLTHSAQNCSILDVPPTSSMGAFSATNSSVPAGNYYSANGVLIPQTSAIHATCFNVVRSSQETNLLTLPQPVICAGYGIQDNISESTAPGLINADCKGDLLQYQLGHTVTTIPPGAFTFLNGTASSTSNFNYLQYMYQDFCTATSNCQPFNLCSPVIGSPIACGAFSFGPDLWLFEDGAAAMSVGNPSANDIVGAGSPSNLTSTAQFAQRIHWRRYWAHGDWLSSVSQAAALSNGTNVISSGFNFFTCKMCSVTDSQTSGILRPSAEGHAVSVSGIYLKLDFNWFEGNSSCVFPGGLSYVSGPPFDAIGSYIPFLNSEMHADRCTYPYAWLGWNGTPGTPSSYVPNQNNGFGALPDTNPYWGGAGDAYGAPPGSAPACNGSQPSTVTCVSISGTTVTWLSGPTFHDNNSNWTASAINVLINNDGTKYKINTIGSGSWSSTCVSAPPGTCPTTLTLTVAPADTCTSGSPCPFVLNGAGQFRKNGEELKECQQCVIDGVIVENVDNTGQQNGTIETIQVRNSSGTTAGGQNYQSTISNFTQSNIILRSACRAPSIVGRSTSTGGGVSAVSNATGIFNALIYDISGANNGCPNGTGDVGFIFGNGGGGQSWNVTVSSSGGTLTATGVASVDQGLTATATVYPSVVSGAGFTDYTIPSTSAALTSAACGPGNQIFVYGFANSANNSSTAGYTCHSSAVNLITLANTGVTADSASTAENNANPVLGTSAAVIGFQVFQMAAGFPAVMSNCGNSALNTATTTINGHTVNTLGPLVTVPSNLWNGTYVAPTVGYPWPTSGTETDGLCILNNGEGGPRALGFKNLTFVTDANESMGDGPLLSNTTQYMQYHLFRDSIIMSNGASKSGWYNTAITAEGTPTEQFDYDITTMSTSKLVWPTRTNTNYTEFGNNSLAVADPAGCTGAGCTPATTYFPTNNCGIGFTGAGSWAFGSCTPSAIPLTTSDYHLYGLNVGSAFHNLGSDGGDIGVILQQIDAAQVQNTFVCHSPCGFPGPYPTN